MKIKQISAFLVGITVLASASYAGTADFSPVLEKFDTQSEMFQSLSQEEKLKQLDSMLADIDTLEEKISQAGSVKVNDEIRFEIKDPKLFLTVLGLGGSIWGYKNLARDHMVAMERKSYAGMDVRHSKGKLFNQTEIREKLLDKAPEMPNPGKVVSTETFEIYDPSRKNPEALSIPQLERRIELLETKLRDPIHLYTDRDKIMWGNHRDGHIKNISLELSNARNALKTSKTRLARIEEEILLKEGHLRYAEKTYEGLAAEAKTSKVLLRNKLATGLFFTGILGGAAYVAKLFSDAQNRAITISEEEKDEILRTLEAVRAQTVATRDILVNQ